MSTLVIADEANDILKSINKSRRKMKNKIINVILVLFGFLAWIIGTGMFKLYWSKILVEQVDALTVWSSIVWFIALVFIVRFLIKED